MPDPNYSSLPPFTKQLIEETVQAVFKEFEKSNPFPQSLFDTPQTAKYLNTSASFLSVLRANGKGPPYIQIESAIRYKRSDIDNWLCQLVIKPTKFIRESGELGVTDQMPPPGTLFTKKCGLGKTNVRA